MGLSRRAVRQAPGDLGYPAAQWGLWVLWRPAARWDQLAPPQGDRAAGMEEDKEAGSRPVHGTPGRR